MGKEKVSHEYYVYAAQLHAYLDGDDVLDGDEDDEMEMGRGRV